MPYQLKQVPGGYVVVNSDTGRPHSKKPLSRTRAKAQMRALYANVPDAAKAAADDTAPTAGGRKPMTPAERARHASLVRWGKEQPFAARLEQVKERRRAAKLAKAKKDKKGKGGKGKAGKPSPEEQRAKARQAVIDAMAQQDTGLAPAGAQALLAFADGGALDSDAAGPLAAMGMLEGDPPRLSADGRAAVAAMNKGDVRGAIDAINRGAEQTREGAARDAERSTRQQEKDKAKAERDKRQQERDQASEQREKVKSGGGGGKKPKEERRKAAEDEEEPDDEPTDDDIAAETAATVGLAAEEAEFLRGAADGDLPPGSFDAERLMSLGLVEDDGDETVATAEGVDAIEALERGDVRGYRRAVRRGKARMRRERGQQERENERETRRKERQQDTLRDRIQRTRERQMLSKEEQDKRVSAEVDRIAAARARKGIEMDDLISDLEAIKTDLQTDIDAAVKAGKRNSSADQDTIDRGYALAEQLCELFEALGATIDDEEEGEEYEEEEGGEVEMMEGKADAFLVGDAVKALENGRIGGLAIRFGSSDEPDMSSTRDYFTKSASYWLDAWDKRPMLYHHALEESTADDPVIGTWTKAAVTDEGVWLEGELNRSYRFHAAIKELVRRGVLRISTDSAPHLVRREAKGGGVHEIKRWPIVAASLTVTPAEPRLAGVSFKSLIDELGLPPEESATAERKAAIEMELIAIEAEMAAIASMAG